MVLRRDDEQTTALRDAIRELLSMAEPHRRYAAMMSGLDLRYGLGDGHPLLGRRMPDLHVVTDAGPQRIFSLLHAASPLLINFVTRGAFDVRPVDRLGPGGRRRLQFAGVSFPK